MQHFALPQWEMVHNYCINREANVTFCITREGNVTFYITTEENDTLHIMTEENAAICTITESDPPYNEIRILFFCSSSD